MDLRYKYKCCVLGLVAAFGGIITFFSLDPLKLSKYTTLCVPKTTKVEKGFIIPSKLELDCQDLDKNGIPETIARYDHKRFLFRYDGDRITGVQYKVKPEIITNK